jgi:hypothetical protein
MASVIRTGIAGQEGAGVDADQKKKARPLPWSIEDLA